MCIVCFSPEGASVNYGTPNAATVYLNDDANPTGYSKVLEQKTGTSEAKRGSKHI